ncbi:hypothetical protein UT4_16040 [Ferrigenium sp. UT4]
MWRTGGACNEKVWGVFGWLCRVRLSVGSQRGGAARDSGHSNHAGITKRRNSKNYSRLTFGKYEIFY